MVSTKEKLEFTYAMGKHSAATLWDCQRIMRYGATYKRLATDMCNREWLPSDEDKKIRTRKAMDKIVKSFGGKLVCAFDPRGCTVKIQVPDGYTNDWGKEGICVPTA